MERYVIGIAGGTGAGKTTLAHAIADTLFRGTAAIIHEDRYYRDNNHLSRIVRERLNFDHPESLDLALLAGHVRALVSGKAIDQPAYDFSLHLRRRETITVSPAGILVVEGLFTLYNDRLRDVLDLKVFLDVDEAVRLSRRLERDVRDRGRTKESILRQWAATVMPMHCRFIEPCRFHADLVLPGEDRIDFNLARIRDCLASKGVL